jgi:hypothetical protein
MNHIVEQNCDSAELYVLGGLSSTEHETFEKHLLDCPECRERLKELQEIVDLLPMSAEPVEVPQGMRNRVLGEVLGTDHVVGAPSSVQERVVSKPDAVVTPPRKRESKGFQRWMVGGLSAAVLLLGFYNISLQQKLQATEHELALLTSPVEQPIQVNQAVALSPGAQDIVAKGLATIVVDARGTHLLVQAEKLPELQGNEAYQVWLLKDGKPHNAGTFLTQDGSGALYFTFAPGDFDTIAITHEPDAVGDQPEGPIVLAAPLKQG